MATAKGCCSDPEADSVVGMAENKSGLSYRRSVALTPKATSQFNQFLPTKDKSAAYVPAPLRKKRAERNEDSRRSWANPAYSEDDATLTSETRLRAYESESGSDSDADRPDPDLVLDDLAGRRFHSPSPAPPANFAVPAGPPAAASGCPPRPPPVAPAPRVAPRPNASGLSGGVRPPQPGSDGLFREISDDSEDSEGDADPVQDDLYSRKMGVQPPAAAGSFDKFLPKFWTPEEDAHVQKIKLGSQKRPWYKKMQGFSYKKSGSSSDDSDGDGGPRLSSSSSSSGPPPPHTHTHQASAHAGLAASKRSMRLHDCDGDGMFLGHPGFT